MPRQLIQPTPFCSTHASSTSLTERHRSQQSSGLPPHFADGESTVAQTEEFIESYSRASGRVTSAEHREIAWATGFWARLFDAKKAVAWGFALPAQLEQEADDRARNAGLLRS